MPATLFRIFADRESGVRLAHALMRQATWEALEGVLRTYRERQRA